MYITPTNIDSISRTSYSEFDLDHEKYGYECYEQIEDSSFTEIRWKNHITGMNFDECFAFSRRLNAQVYNSKNHKFGGFAYPWAKSLGISTEDLMNLSKAEIREKYDTRLLLEQKKERYRSRLINLIKGAGDVL